MTVRSTIKSFEDQGAVSNRLQAALCSHKDFRGGSSSLHWMDGLEAHPVHSPGSQPAPRSGGSPDSGVLTQVTSGSGTAADELQGPEQLFQFSVSSQANGGLEKAISQSVGRIHKIHMEIGDACHPERTPEMVPFTD